MTSFAINKQMVVKSLSLFGSLLVTVLLITLLCNFFTPYWQTNDDIGMSMAAHGYGFATYNKSPTLIFSNVLWGYITRAIPEIHGILGYSVATLATLVLIGTAILYNLSQLGWKYIAVTAAIILILVRPILFPQFTVNAGLLCVAAISCWYVFVKCNSRRTLVLGCIIFLLSYLIRSQEGVLVLVVAAPLLPWRRLLSTTFAKNTFAALILAILASVLIDGTYYKGEEWKDFNELNPPRALFTDFGAGVHLQNRPDILARHGYSYNDINLIQNWFFVDGKLTNPQALWAMLKDLGTTSIKHDSLANIKMAAHVFLSVTLLPALIAAALLGLLLPSRRLALSWLCCIGAVTAIGIMGRPEVLRVFMPLTYLLLIAPLLTSLPSERRQRLATSILLLAAIINTCIAFHESKQLQASYTAISQNFAGFPTYPIVVWGAGLPLEAMFPVLTQSRQALHYQFYGLGAFTLAPMATSYSEHAAGRGMLERLMSKDGVPIIANSQSLQFLRTYCQEHYNRNLNVLSSQQWGTYTLEWIRCE